MSDSYPILFLDKPSDKAISWVAQQLTKVGLEVVLTFNLQVTRHDPSHCPCPHHGTGQCDCQMAVMLVYGNAYHPISLVIHSYDRQTWILLVDSPHQRASPRLERMIRQALPREPSPPLGQNHDTQASLRKA
jgi:hypothetical protein